MPLTTRNMDGAFLSMVFLQTTEKVLKYASKLPLSFSSKSSTPFPAVCFLLALPWPMMLYGVVNTKCLHWRQGAA